MSPTAAPSVLIPQFASAAQANEHPAGFIKKHKQMKLKCLSHHLTLDLFTNANVVDIHIGPKLLLSALTWDLFRFKVGKDFTSLLS